MDFGVIVHILNRWDELELACVDMFGRKRWFFKSSNWFVSLLWEGNAFLPLVSLTPRSVYISGCFPFWKLRSVQRQIDLSLEERGHKYAKWKTTMISLIAGTFGPACSKNLPLEDPLVPINVSLSSKGWQPDGQWALDPDIDRLPRR